MATGPLDSNELEGPRLELDCGSAHDEGERPAHNCDEVQGSDRSSPVSR